MAAKRNSVRRFSTSGFFSLIRFPQAPEYTIRAVSNFFKSRGDIHSSRCTTGVVDAGGKWKKVFKLKYFNYFVRTPLGSRVNIDLKFCLQVHFKMSET